MKKVEDGKGTIYLVLHISLVLKYIVLASVCQGYCDRIVDVLRFCHQITVQGKCHHGRKSDIEPERTGKVNGT